MYQFYKSKPIILSETTLNTFLESPKTSGVFQTVWDFSRKILQKRRKSMCAPKLYRLYENPHGARVRRYVGHRSPDPHRAAGGVEGSGGRLTVGWNEKTVQK